MSLFMVVLLFLILVKVWQIYRWHMGLENQMMANRVLKQKLGRWPKGGKKLTKQQIIDRERRAERKREWDEYQAQQAKEKQDG